MRKKPIVLDEKTTAQIEAKLDQLGLAEGPVRNWRRLNLQRDAAADQAHLDYERQRYGLDRRKLGRPLMGGVKREPVMITLPPILVQKMTERAKRDRLSRSQLIEAALEALLKG